MYTLTVRCYCMKQITYRMLQQSAKWMVDLPVELTRYGKVVAIISSPEKNLENKKIASDPEVIVTQSQPMDIVPKPEVAEQIVRPALWKCSHGNIGKLCKDPKCRGEAIKQSLK